MTGNEIREKIEEIMEDAKERYKLDDSEAESTLAYARRKMELNGKPDDYILLLLPDELRNYAFRRAVNATTMLRAMERRQSHV